MSEQKDIFDKIMSLPGLRCFYGLYEKYKEVLLYILFGGVSTVVSIGSFVLCETGLGMNELVANVISWVLAVSTAYATNRTWVFGSKAKGKAFWKEIVRFLSLVVCRTPLQSLLKSSLRQLALASTSTI